LADFDALPIRWWPSSAALPPRAFTLRDNLSADDAGYVVLAEALDCALVTNEAGGGEGESIIAEPGDQRDGTDATLFGRHP
jgi:hypothetical protein